MTTFKAFANDSQALTFSSGSDELSLENGTEAVLLFGTLTLTKGDAESAQALRELIDALQATLAAMD